MDSDERRVRADVVARLEARGVAAFDADSNDDLARLLDAVERFEHTVERRGGDLMVDEPVGAEGDRPNQPDDRRFVLPRRNARESAEAFIARIDDARSRAARAA